MAVWRCYVDKKITEDEEGVAVGGDHSRVIDYECEGSPVAEISRLLEDDEQITQVVTIAPDDLSGHFGLDTVSGSGLVDLGDGHWVVRKGADSS